MTHRPPARVVRNDERQFRTTASARQRPSIRTCARRRRRRVRARRFVPANSRGIAGGSRCARPREPVHGRERESAPLIRSGPCVGSSDLRRRTSACSALNDGLSDVQLRTSGATQAFGAADGEPPRAPGSSAWYHESVPTTRLGALLAAATFAGSGCGRLGYEQPALAARPDAGPDGGGPGRDGGHGDPLDSALTPEDAPAPADARADAETDAGPCDQDPCRLVFPQCGCPAGQMCTRTMAGSATRSCIPSGSTALAEACTFNPECEPGHACVQVNGAGVCALWCRDDGACLAGTECVRLRVDDPVGACRVPCDAVRNVGCPSGMFCYVERAGHIEGGTLTVTVCGGAGTTAAGNACGSSFGCQPGLVCRTGVCRPLCDLDAAACAGAATCTSVDMSADGIRYGACVVSG